MHELLKKYDNKGFTVTVRELDITENQNYRPQLRRVKHSDDENIIISSSIEALPEILKQAQQVGLLTEKHQFIITTLDMHTIDLEPFQHSGANITGVRLISPEDPMVVQVTDFFAEKYAEKMEKEKEKNTKSHKEKNESKDDDDNDDKKDEEDDEDDDNDEEPDVPEGLTADHMRVDTALTYDAVLVFSEVVKLEGGVRVRNIKCDDDSVLREHGISDSMAMKTIPSIRGLSGDIHFDQKGHRSNFQVEIIELASDGIRKIGTWNTTDGLYLARFQPTIDESVLSLRNKTFTVLTALVSQSDRSFIISRFTFA
jgi:glutamate receptor, ionotropic, invertebrate